VTSANVACGGHAGSPATMRWVCEQALARGVQIGAHVSYVDRDGFGRRDLSPEPSLLIEQIATQITTLCDAAAPLGGSVSYVKPHGALYNRAARDPERAAQVIAGILASGLQPAVLTLPDSALAHAAQAAGLVAVAEGYADRAYEPSGSLRSRTLPGAVLDPDAALVQALALARHETVHTAGGAGLTLAVQSICLHSDTPGAPALARRLRAGLIAAGVDGKAFR